MSNIKKNFIYISVYNFLLMLLPIVTSPILSRRLGVELLGIYNYVDAIVSIFLVFASTGIYRYGMREIAKYKENKDLMSQKYINIVLVNILNVFFVISIYFLFVIYMVDETNRMYFWIKLVTLLTVIFDNAFLYYGLENIKILTLRDGLTKIVAFVCIVIFIKSSEDIYLYFIIMSICPFISAFWGFIYSRRFIKFKIPELKECKKLYKPLIILMIPSLSYIIYQSMDKVMINTFYNASETGYYACASKVLVLRTIITSLGTAMCPHLVSLYSKGNIEIANKKFVDSLLISLIIAIFSLANIIAISKEFAPIFWGSSFSVCSNLMIGFAISIPIWCISEVIRTQYLLPHGRDNQYMLSFIIGLIINAISNVLLIPIWGAIGAILSIILSELMMSFIQAWFIRKEVCIKYSIYKCIPYVIIALISILIVRGFVLLQLNITIITLILEILVSIISFSILVCFYEYITNKKIILNIIFNKMKKTL